MNNERWLKLLKDTQRHDLDNICQYMYISISISILFFIKYIYIFVTLLCSVLVITFAFSLSDLTTRLKRITLLCQILSKERLD